MPKKNEYMADNALTMDKLVSLCKRRGFIFAGSEIYGGLANSWDYGPLGSQMRMNIKSDWWKRVVESRQDIVGIDGALMMNSKVWEASGHVDGFSDPLVEDVKTHKRYRADHIIEAALSDVNADGLSADELNKIIKDNHIKSPDGNELSDVKSFNLMFETYIGKTEDNKQTVYLRPETAQSMFVSFKNVLDTSRKRLPFGIAQMGKAFRNEITPGNFIFRTLEFEAMEVEYFVEEKDWKSSFEDWMTWMEAYAESVGIAKEKLHRLEVPEESLAHYSKRTVDFEFDFPFGTKELWGLAYRTDFDLSNHAEHSGQKLLYTDPTDPKNKFVPHVVEPAMGVDRTLLAILVSAYTEEEVEEGDTRVVMKFKPHIAPYQVAVLPLMKKDGLPEKATEVLELLSGTFRCEYDVTGSVGKRYRRQDEIGTPFCITVDHDTLIDNTVTVRDRDTMQQERVSLDTLKTLLFQKI